MYTPIDCSYYDRIEHYATRAEVVLIRYRDPAGGKRECKSRISDTRTSKEGEFMILEDGLRIRMDRIISLNGIMRPLPCLCRSELRRGFQCFGSFHAGTMSS